MFEDTNLFGISMASRINRRALGLLTYAITAAIIAGFVVLLHAVGEMPGHSI